VSHTIKHGETTNRSSITSVQSVSGFSPTEFAGKISTIGKFRKGGKGWKALEFGMKEGVR